MLMVEKFKIVEIRKVCAKTNLKWTIKSHMRHNPCQDKPRLDDYRELFALFCP